MRPILLLGMLALRIGNNTPDNYTGELGPCSAGHVVVVHTRYGFEREYMCDRYKSSGCSLISK
jgi:hypothetical protein